jgi:hypothetical protein
MNPRLRALASSVLATLCWAQLGCPGPRAVYGDRASYSPEMRGYVMSVDMKGNTGLREARDARGPWAILRDPVTLDKLRCQEDGTALAAQCPRVVRGRAWA